MRPLRSLAFATVVLLGALGSAPAQSPWQPLTHQPSFQASNPLLLTDGTILVHDAGAADWWKLTPDQNGSYVNGTWSQVASLPTGYAPLYYSSAVLPNGQVIVEGGEYNLGHDAWTNKGAIYNPLTNTWTSMTPPSGWAQIGDAPGVVLASGTYMQTDCCDQPPKAALLDPTTLTWTATGSGKFDVYDEEGITLLPGGKVLDVDAYVFVYNQNGKNSEIYDPNSGSWSSAGSTVVQLWDSCGGSGGASYELGPAVLRPDGTVFATGANGCGAGHTAIYNSSTGVWTAGPDFPDDLDIADGPAALLPDGNVLMMTSPGIFNTGAVFFEWDGTNLNQVAGPPNAPSDSSYYGNMLVLPTGQVMFTDFSQDVEIYTPTGSANPSWEPSVVLSLSSPIISRGSTIMLSGRKFNGYSQAVAYGDDEQAATNYPIVRLTNASTGHVFYGRTHDHSTMAVGYPGPAYTHVDIPSNMETGQTYLEVVANGIASPRYNIGVR
jgi:Kelch motif